MGAGDICAQQGRAERSGSGIAGQWRRRGIVRQPQTGGGGAAGWMIYAQLVMLVLFIIASRLIVYLLRLSFSRCGHIVVRLAMHVPAGTDG